MDYYVTGYSSPLGEITLASDGQNLTGLWFKQHRYSPDLSRAKAAQAAEIPVLQAAQEWLDRYFAGEQPKISELPLAPAGGEFRKAVWQILCEIPYGSVTTYGQIAERIASERGLAKMAAQAVGGAVGHNPISIIIPCHRVVGTNGSLTGYGGGIALKVKLLTLEGVDMSKLFIPKKGTAL